MIIYHYTHSPRWKEIKQDGLQPNRLEGIVRSPDFFAFGLLDPTPDAWTRNKDFPTIWESLKGHIGEILLEIKVDPESDEVYVVDRGHYEGSTGENPNIPPRYRHSSLEEGTKAYIGSRVPLKDYLRQAEHLQYSLPEIIFGEPISPDRIHVSETQPLLEEDIALKNWIRGIDEPPQQNTLKEKEVLARERLKTIPELGPWFETYRGKLIELQREGVSEGMLK